MKHTYEMFDFIYPILLGRPRAAMGGSSMQHLQLRGLEQETTGIQGTPDVYKFPQPVSRIGAWRPRPLHETDAVSHDAEAALAQVQANLDQLGLMLSGMDPDRPRAA